MYRYFKQIAGVGNDNYNYYWQSEGYSDKQINSIKTLNHTITPNYCESLNKSRILFGAV